MNRTNDIDKNSIRLYIRTPFVSIYLPNKRYPKEIFVLEKEKENLLKFLSEELDRRFREKFNEFEPITKFITDGDTG